MWFKWFLVGLWVLAGFGAISDVGKTKSVKTPAEAMLAVAFAGALIAGLLYYWR